MLSRDYSSLAVLVYSCGLVCVGMLSRDYSSLAVLVYSCGLVCVGMLSRDYSSLAVLVYSVLVCCLCQSLDLPDFILFENICRNGFRIFALLYDS